MQLPRNVTAQEVVLPAGNRRHKPVSAALRLGPPRWGRTAILSQKAITPGSGGHQRVSAGRSCSVRASPQSPYFLCCLAAVSRPASPPVISEPSRPISTSPSCLQLSAWRRTQRQRAPENSFIQHPRDIPGDFACKPRAACRRLRSTEPTGAGSRAAWGGGQHTRSNRSLRGLRPSVATASRTGGQAAPGNTRPKLAPPHAGPRSRGKRARGPAPPARDLRVPGFGARARTQF